MLHDALHDCKQWPMSRHYLQGLICQTSCDLTGPLEEVDMLMDGKSIDEIEKFMDENEKTLSENPFARKNKVIVSEE